MKKLVATLMVGIVFTCHVISVNAAPEAKYVGEVITDQGTSQEMTVNPQVHILAKSKPTLSYKAKLSVSAAAVYGTTLYLSSTAKIKNTGAAVRIDKMTISGKITGTDKQSKSGSKIGKNTSSLSYQLYTSDYGKGTLKQCSGVHKFENKGYYAKTLNTKKTYNN